MGKDHGSAREQNRIGFHSPSRGALRGAPFFMASGSGRVGSGINRVGSGWPSTGRPWAVVI